MQVEGQPTTYCQPATMDTDTDGVQSSAGRCGGSRQAIHEQRCAICHPGAHTRVQSSTRRQFDENLFTYHSAKSSIMHGPVQKGHTNVFGGRGRVLPLQGDATPSPSVPSGTISPLSHPVPCYRPCTPSQLPRLGAALGALQERLFGDFPGMAMGISMPPPVQGTSPPTASGWATQPRERAPRGTDAESIARSAGEHNR